ncbi:MAG: hypothetical protein QOC93_2672 [Actinomycetota bacterium]|nr:hypothetical protein [Actinomycetota bacterium]
MDDNASIARKFYESWNARDFAYGEKHTAPECEIVIVGSGDTLRGPEGARQFATMWADAFPDGKTTVDRLIAAGDEVVVEYTGRGTQTGPFTTPAGSIPPTGRSVTLNLCDVMVIRDGLLRSQHTYVDTASLLMQLGVMPAPEPAKQ